MRYRLDACFFVNESLKRDNKKENDEIKNVIKRSSLRCCCVFTQ